MAFACLKQGEVTYSFHYSLEEWINLKTKAKSLDLKMNCCGSPAIMKTSALGTQFFAHKSKGSDNCDAGNGESKEHLYAKYIVSKTLHGMGWHVELEKRGSTPDGQVWIADIYAEKGRAKMAVEIQWSPQGYVETMRRQDLYTSSGVRAVWLLKSGSSRDKNALVGDYAWRTKNMPVFTLVKAKDASMQVYGVYAPYTYRQLRAVSLTLERFITELFSGRLEFVKQFTNELGLSVITLDKECWQCEQGNTLVKTILKRKKVFGVWKKNPCDTINVRELSMSDMALVNARLSKAHGFKALEKRRVAGEIKGCPTNSCINCGATLGAGYEFIEDYGKDWHESDIVCLHKAGVQASNGEWFYKSEFFDESNAEYVTSKERLPDNHNQLNELSTPTVADKAKPREARAGVHSYEVFEGTPSRSGASVTISTGENFPFMVNRMFRS